MNLKKCNYCQALRPEDEFVKLKKGRGGKTTVMMCGQCHAIRKAGVKPSLDALVQTRRTEVRREFNPFYRDMSK